MARERKFTTNELFQEVKQLLLQHGYDAFHFGLLAERLDVSRGALYKYYENKDTLITAFMTYEMNMFLGELQAVQEVEGFREQFDQLVDIIFRKKEVLPLIRIAQHMVERTNTESREQLEKLPLAMYAYLQRLIVQGKQEGVLKAHLPDSVMLGLLFQSIAVPNHFNIPQSEWVEAMKEVLGQGMFT